MTTRRRRRQRRKRRMSKVSRNQLKYLSLMSSAEKGKGTKSNQGEDAPYSGPTEEL
jgi:hypothetical protein